MGLFRRRTPRPSSASATGGDSTSPPLPPGWESTPPDRWPLIPREGTASDPLALGWGVGDAPTRWHPAGEDPGALLISGPAGSGKTTLARLLCDQAVCHNLAVLVLHADHRHYPGHHNLRSQDPDLARALQQTVQPGRCVVVDLHPDSSAHEPWPRHEPPPPNLERVAQAVSALGAQLIGDAIPAIVVVDGDYAVSELASTLPTLSELGVWIVAAVQQPDRHTDTLGGLRPQLAMLAPNASRAAAAGELCPAWAIEPVGAVPGGRGRGVQITDQRRAIARFVIPDDGEWVNAGGFVGQRISRSVAIDARNPGTAEDASL